MAYDWKLNVKFFRQTEKWNLEDDNDLSIGTNKLTGTLIGGLAYPLVFTVPSDFCIK